MGNTRDKLDGLGDTNVNDELDRATDELDGEGDTSVDEELDHGVEERDGVDDVADVEEQDTGMDDLEMVRSQPRCSPDGLFRIVGRTSSRLLYALVCLSALYMCRDEQIVHKVVPR